MSSGFRFVLAGACLMALVFVAASLWRYLPELDIVWRNATQNPPAISSQLPAKPALHAQATAPATATKPAAAVPATPPTPLAVTTQQVVEDSAAEARPRWLQTTDNAIMHRKPAGDPLIALSLSKAPLTVLSGSYLREVRREQGWVLIMSPSRTLGWVREREVKALPE